MTLTEILLTDRTTDTLMDVDTRHTLPRYLKTRAEQEGRTKTKAEVFTPSWVCNAQNNLIDEAWFGRKNVFNTEADKAWKTNPNKIDFPDNRSWKDYIADTRLEITCGEAPYLASRYDTVSGEYIPVPDRIGILDRKLRVIGEHSLNSTFWLMFTTVAVQNTYGYEYQQDNIWLARKNIVQSVKEHYRYRFHQPMPKKDVETIAYIASWNIFRMDGLKTTIPETCSDICKGCRKRKSPLEGIHLHDGIYAKIMDWNFSKAIEFREVMTGDKEPTLF